MRQSFDRFSCSIASACSISPAACQSPAALALAIPVCHVARAARFHRRRRTTAQAADKPPPAFPAHHLSKPTAFAVLPRRRPRVSIALPARSEETDQSDLQPSSVPASTVGVIFRTWTLDSIEFSYTARPITGFLSRTRGDTISPVGKLSANVSRDRSSRLDFNLSVSSPNCQCSLVL